MKLFEFTKYFFDIFSSEKDYLVLFISIIKIGKIHKSYIQIHYSASDSSGKYKSVCSVKAKLKLVDCQLNQIRFKEGTIDFGAGSVSISLATVSCEVDLKYMTAHQGSETINSFVIRNSKNASLSWTPLQIKGSVNGKISMDGNQLYYSNTSGYIDEVKTSILPFTLKINKLFWGRLHHEEIDLTYSLMTDNNAKSKSILFVRFRNMIIEFSDIQYQTSGEKINHNLNISYPDKLLLTATSESSSVSIEIFDHKELILNDFMDPGDQYNRIFSRFVRRISNDPKGIKFLAKANILLEDSREKSSFHELSMISEYVSFYG
jgi:hypothetical protein